jgi:acetoin:2,6-dichlorophenolindophenol oxidoreductase subunit alpha
VTAGRVKTPAWRAMYRDMLRIRRLEEALADAITAGEISTPTHLCIGQEAVAVGVCHALRPADIVFGNHRSHGHFLAKGGGMAALAAEVFGRATGCSRGRGGSMHLIDPEAGVLGTVPIVAGTVPLAVGAALAAQLRDEDRVTVAFFGDGALEEGVTHESLNLAAQRALAVVFVCENNFYASHLHLLERRAQDNIPDAGPAHGLPSARVDGNDVVEVRGAAAAAVQAARAGRGPTLLECRTFRWRGHVGPALDLEVGSGRASEIQGWLDRDPIALLAQRLLDSGEATQEGLNAIAENATREVAAALAAARSAPWPDPEGLIDDVYGRPDPVR